MTDELEKVEEQNVMENDYLQTITDLKANSVSKNEYNKMLEENRKLLNTIVNGGGNQPETEEAPTRSISEIRDELFNTELSNLDFCKNALELRDRILSETGQDIFVAHNSRYTPGTDSYEAAARVAQVMSECIEYADGDSQAFTTELMRRTNDVNLPGRR